MCRSPLWLALAAAALCAVTLHDFKSRFVPQIHKALEHTSLRSDSKALVESVTLNVLPIALPIAIFLIVFVVLGALRAVCSADHTKPISHTKPIEAQYVAMPPQRGEWSDGLFGCLNDIPVCLVSCLLPPVIVGQLYERVTGKRGACTLIVVAVVGLSVHAATVTSTMCSRCSVEADHSRIPKISCPDGQQPPQVCAWVDMAAMLCFLSMVALVVIARSRIRNARLVDGGTDACCADGCASFCCLPLAAAQATRHLNAVESTVYSLGSPTGRKPTSLTRNSTGRLVIHVQWQCPHYEHGPAAAPVPMGIPVR